jgi:hypothetical protein
MPKGQKPEQAIVRTGRGEEQPAGKDRAQQKSGLERGPRTSPPQLPRVPGETGIRKDAKRAAG